MLQISGIGEVKQKSSETRAQISLQSSKAVAVIIVKRLQRGGGTLPPFISFRSSCKVKRCRKGIDATMGTEIAKLDSRIRI